MPIKTGSVLEKLCATVDMHRKRVARAQARVERLREEYSAAHWSKRRDIASKGFTARETLKRASDDLFRAETALREEETRLLQPDAFLRFG